MATGFKDEEVKEKQIHEKMNTEAVLKQKSTKRNSTYETPDEPQSDAMKRLKVSCF